VNHAGHPASQPLQAGHFHSLKLKIIRENTHSRGLLGAVEGALGKGVSFMAEVQVGRP
jgi:hypothetical protein